MEEINNRKMNQQYFKEETLIYSILKPLLQCLSDLQDNKIIFESMNPQQISVKLQKHEPSQLIHDSFQVKISDNVIFDIQSNYDQIFYDSKGHLKAHYLSPYLYEVIILLHYSLSYQQLYQNAQIPLHNSQKSTVFCLGMTLLHAALLENQEDCYNPNGTFNKLILKSKFQQIQKIYSIKLEYILRMLLQEKESLRFNFNEFLAHLETLEQLDDDKFLQEELEKLKALEDKMMTVYKSIENEEEILQQAKDFYQSSRDILKKKQQLESKNSDESLNLLLSPRQSKIDKKQINEQNQNGVMELKPFFSNQQQISQINIPLIESQKNGSVNRSVSQLFNGNQQNNTPLQIPIKGLPRNWEKLKFSNGSYYIGQINNGQMNGIGNLFTKSGFLAYEGQWLNGQFHGQGTLYNENPKNFEIQITNLETILQYCVILIQFGQELDQVFWNL